MRRPLVPILDSPSADAVIARARDVERALRAAVNAQRRRWRYQLRRGRVRFDAEIRQRQLAFRQTIPAYIRDGSLRNLLTAPIIYSLFVPLALLDGWISLYQWICFPIYGVARVPRRAYFVLDRHKLAYLNGVEKLNCTYCSYANGLLAYVREVTARTEQYWCPIRHAGAVRAPHERYHLFTEFGDARGYHRDLPVLRRALDDERARDAAVRARARRRRSRAR